MELDQIVGNRSAWLCDKGGKYALSYTAKAPTDGMLNIFLTEADNPSEPPLFEKNVKITSIVKTDEGWRGVFNNGIGIFTVEMEAKDDGKTLVARFYLDDLPYEEKELMQKMKEINDPPLPYATLVFTRIQ